MRHLLSRLAETVKRFVGVLRLVMPRRQTCFIYCPRCGRELIKHGEHLGQRAGLEIYLCRCGLVTEWDFDAPEPLLIEEERAV